MTSLGGGKVESPRDTFNNWELLLETIDERHAVVDWLVDRFKAEHGINLRNRNRYEELHRLEKAAEAAKIDLSSCAQIEIYAPFIATEDGSTHLEETFTCEMFESLTDDLLERTVEPTEKARGRRVSTNDVDEVMLVGGSTRMPQVAEKVEAMTGTVPRRNVNPAEAVMLEAAIQGYPQRRGRRHRSTRRYPLSLGLEVKGRRRERTSR